MNLRVAVKLVSRLFLGLPCRRIGFIAFIMATKRLCYFAMRSTVLLVHSRPVMRIDFELRSILEYTWLAGRALIEELLDCSNNRNVNVFLILLHFVCFYFERSSKENKIVLYNKVYVLDCETYNFSNL